MNEMIDKCDFCKRTRVEHEIAEYNNLCYGCKLLFKNADKEHCLLCNQPEHMMYHRYIQLAHFDSDEIDILEFSDPEPISYDSYKICYACAHYKLNLALPPEKSVR